MVFTTTLGGCLAGPTPCRSGWSEDVPISCLPAGYQVATVDGAVWPDQADYVLFMPDSPVNIGDRAAAGRRRGRGSDEALPVWLRIRLSSVW